MNEPSVYLIVLNWNGSKLLEETLLSLQKITYKNYKIIVVDNGSVDESVEMLKAKFPQVYLIQNDKNLGFGGGNNVGIEFCLSQKTDYVLLLNNDVEVDKDFVTEMVKVAESSGKIGLVAPKIYYFEPKNRLWFAGGKVSFATGLISHVGLRETDKGLYDKVCETDYVCGCAMLIKRKVLEKIGMFDPIFNPAYVEDADLSQRAKLASYKLFYAPKGIVWHKVSSTLGAMSSAKTKLKIRNNFIFFKRYAKPYNWLTIVPSVVFGTLLFLLKQIFTGNFRISGSVLQGFLSIFKGKGKK
ncbi:glycosyltransferase family 2 protein [bacterium]|nr:glycosyltransferase family 2 protein [bacterium]